MAGATRLPRLALLRLTLVAAALAVGCGGLALPARAQWLPETAPSSAAARPAIVVLDQDRLFRESAFGTEVDARVEAEVRALTAENRRIETELSAEERELTERRRTMGAEEFARLADDFDRRVVAIRAEQEAKVLQLNAWQEKQRKLFFSNARPIIAAVLDETGAVAMLDSNSVIMTLKAVDVTDLAIRRVNERLVLRPEGDPLHGSAGHVPPEGAEAPRDGAGAGDPAPAATPEEAGAGEGAEPAPAPSPEAP